MKKKAIICDLDGTLSLFDREKRNPYDRDFENDECSWPVKFILESYRQSFSEGEVFFLSGRNNKFRDQTEQFIDEHLPFLNYHLVMREERDFRKDVIVKEEMYNTHIKDKYNVDFVIDDRLQVCRLWYSLGLFVFNVNQGLEEF